MIDLEYYLKELTAHKFVYDKLMLVDWLSDVSGYVCDNLKIPRTTYNYRLQEEERILQRILFSAKTLYQQNTGHYNGVNLGDVISKINPEDLAIRIVNGDDNPFKER